MYRATAIIPFLFISSMLTAQHTIHMEIKSLPEHHPSGSDIYIAGSFNGWNPQDNKFRLNRDQQGNYYIDLTLAEGTYEYKFTRGGWDKTECKKGGAGKENRIVKVPATTVVAVNIEEWTDRFPVTPRVSTASKNVRVIDTAFLVPQLKRTRRIWVYLPENYSDGSTTRYPVLYMHDGQNIFDDATSYSGEWGLDEFFDTTFLKKCIVVGIDNGGTKRLNEYNPYDNDRFGKGEGDLYVDFLVKTLKPFIDKRYRTLKGKTSTWIAGSSMGGLISMYAVLKYPAVFGGAGVFSPAFWISGPRIYDDIRKKGKKVNSRIYFYGGKLEGESMVPDMIKAYDEMQKVSRSTMITVIRDEGKHNEAAWRREFPLFYQWLLSN
jgi:predicted alpha/beta superfamily hydrolase